MSRPQQPPPGDDEADELSDRELLRLVMATNTGRLVIAVVVLLLVAALVWIVFCNRFVPSEVRPV